MKPWERVRLGAQYRGPAKAAGPGRRGDRVGWPMSASGTKRTWRGPLAYVRFRGEADVI